MALGSDAASVASMDTSVSDLASDSGTDLEDSTLFPHAQLVLSQQNRVQTTTGGFAHLRVLVQGTSGSNRAVHLEAHTFEGEVLQVVQAQLLGRPLICICGFEL